MYAPPSPPPYHISCDSFSHWLSQNPPTSRVGLFLPIPYEFKVCVLENSYQINCSRCSSKHLFRKLLFLADVESVLKNPAASHRLEDQGLCLTWSYQSSSVTAHITARALPCKHVVLTKCMCTGNCPQTPECFGYLVFVSFFCILHIWSTATPFSL